MKPNEFLKQANDFLTKTGAKIKMTYIGNAPHFEDDKKNHIHRDRYRVTISRNGKKMSVIFGQSIAAAGTEPTVYTILSHIQKYDCGTFDNFCGSFGYDTDSRTAERVYKAVCDEYKSLCTIFSDTELTELQEIE